MYVPYHVLADELEAALTQHADDLKSLMKERDELAEWKRQHMLVEAGWNPQEIGEMLGMKLGSRIRANLKPRIESLLQQRDALWDVVDEAIKWDGYDETGEPAVWLGKAEQAIDSITD